MQYIFRPVFKSGLSERSVSVFLFVFLISIVQKCRDIVFKLHVLLQIVEIESQAVF